MADTEKIIRKKYDVPIWHKSNLTIDEAVEYSGIGREVTAFIMGLTVHKRRHQATASVMNISQHRQWYGLL